MTAILAYLRVSKSDDVMTMASLADLLIERAAQAGMARVRGEGKTIGRPYKTSPEQRIDILAWLAAGETVSAVARKYGISRAAVIAARTAHREANGVTA